MFVSCPACACPAKTNETECPSCGTKLRSADGTIARTAIAVLLGITAATGLAACGSPPAPKYGVPATDGPVPTAELEAQPTSQPSVPPEGMAAPAYGVPGSNPVPPPAPENNRN
jgi:hypothetical protein